LGNSTPITADGGNLQFANGASAGVVYSETVGTVTLNSGQFDILENTSQTGGSGNQQTLTLSGLAHNGTSAVTFSAVANPDVYQTPTGLNTTTNIIRNTAFGSATPAGQIIGPWATVGRSTSQQKDYAVYDASGNIVGANIANSAETTWTSASNAYTMAATNYANGTNQNDSITVNLTGNRTMAGLRNFGQNDTLNLGANNLYTYGLLQGGRNSWTINSSGGAVSTPSGGGNLYITAGNDDNNPFIQIYAPITDNGGAVTVVKSGYNNLYLRGTNSYTGGLVLNAGTTYLQTASAAGGGTITFNGGSIDEDNTANFNLANNPLTINADFSYNGSGNYSMNLGAGAVSLGTAPGSTRNINVNNAATLTIGGIISNGTTANSLSKSGSGTLVLGGANLYTGGVSVTGGTLFLNNTSASLGATTVTSGTLIARNGSALGGNSNTAGVTVAAGRAFNYNALTDAQLAIGGNLAVTAGNTILGASIGGTPTSAEINVGLAATISNAAHKINIYGINGVTPAAGTNTYTLIHGGTNSSLNPATAPTINAVYNNTGFTLGAAANFTRTATDLQLDITSATPLTAAYWTGNATAGTTVWAISSGLSGSTGVASSNWATAPATTGAQATAQVLVPGSGTNVFFAAPLGVQGDRTQPNGLTLGSDMSVASLTFNDFVNNALTLNADGYALTVGSGGISYLGGLQNQTVTINSAVKMATAQTWTNNTYQGTFNPNGWYTGAPNTNVDGTNALTVNGNVDNGGNLLTVNTAYGNININGAVSGANGLTKMGGYGLTLSGASTYTGATTINYGTLYLGGTGAPTGSPLGTTAAGTYVNGNNAALDLNGQSILTNEPLFLNGNNGNGALTNGSTAATWTGPITLQSDSSIGGNVIVGGSGAFAGGGFNLYLNRDNTTGTFARVIDSTVA